jgi:hypothetical protein
MRADLDDEEHAIAHSLQASAHPVFGLFAVILATAGQIAVKESMRWWYSA